MKKYILLFLVLGLLSVSVPAQTKVNVRFARGANSTKLSGSVSGYKYIDYVVGARGGQTMSVKLESASSYASFVVFDPAMDNVEGATEQIDWTGDLPSNGKYTIRVLLPRSAARRGVSARYSLKISID
jgi:hypothetical protein